MQVGLISDTHGLMRDEALRALEGSELIIHAGDVGKPAILATLRAIAPVVAVRGNIDHGDWADALPETAVAQAGTSALFVLHDVHQLDLEPVAAGLQAVISGHSHKPGHHWRQGVLYLNPGSAGPRRFSLPITLARIDVKPGAWTIQFVDLVSGAVLEQAP